MTNINEKAVSSVIKKAKYHVKNAEGQYDLVYLETSADQVEETSDKVFLTPAQRNQIEANKNAIAQEVSNRTAADNNLAKRLDVIQGTGEGSVKKALADAKAYTDSEISRVNGENSNLAGRVTTAEGNIRTLQGQMGTAKTDIDNLKDAVANKNNNTIVVSDVNEIPKENPNPKVGDIAYVVNDTIKKAYIYKGVNAIVDSKAIPVPPAGWMLFDEITTELDLVDYLKKTDADAKFRAKSVKIAEVDLAQDFINKVNGKANTSYVDTTAENKVAPVRDKANKVESDLATEINARKAADTNLNDRISKLVPTVAAQEPVGKEVGHVWLKI